MNRQELKTFIKLIEKYREENGCEEHFSKHECFSCLYRNERKDCVIMDLLLNSYEKCRALSPV